MARTKKSPLFPSRLGMEYGKTVLSSTFPVCHVGMKIILNLNCLFTKTKLSFMQQKGKRLLDDCSIEAEVLSMTAGAVTVGNDVLDLILWLPGSVYKRFVPQTVNRADHYTLACLTALKTSDERLDSEKFADLYNAVQQSPRMQKVLFVRQSCQKVQLTTLLLFMKSTT